MRLISPPCTALLISCWIFRATGFAVLMMAGTTRVPPPFLPPFFSSIVSLFMQNLPRTQAHVIYHRANFFFAGSAAVGIATLTREVAHFVICTEKSDLLSIDNGSPILIARPTPP